MRECLYTSCLLLAVKWSKDLHTYYPPLLAHAEYCGGVVGDTPDDMEVGKNTTEVGNEVEDV